MLTITIKAREGWDEDAELFKGLDRDWTLQLEHSLISITKWEQKYHKPYLTDEKKSKEELLDYIRCMTVTPNVPSEVYDFLSKDNLHEIQQYINDPMTATVFNDYRPGGKQSKIGRREFLTNELIYYYMTSYGISWQAEKWHINRLLTLINVHAIKDSDGKKMSKKDIINRNSELNKARRAMMGSKG